MMQIDTTNSIAASLVDLVRVRPDKNATGFAPGGRVSTHQFGTNHSVFKGRGMEFDEARIYQPGDDVRSIDWRVTARTGKVHTKLYHEERERPVFILLDCRAMMHFGTRVRFKSVLAAHIASMLCWVGVDGGDRVGGFILTTSGLRDFPATRTRQGMLAFLNAMGEATQNHPSETENEKSLQEAVKRLRHVARPGTLVFIISDFSDFDMQTEREINRLSLHAHVTNIHLYDQLDAHLPQRGNHAISDGNGTLLLSALGKSKLSAYEDAFNTRKDRLEQMCRKRNMAFHSLSTADEPKQILHIKQSNHRSKQRRAA